MLYPIICLYINEEADIEIGFLMPYDDRARI